MFYKGMMRSVAVATIVVATAGLAACGGGSSAPASASSNELKLSSAVQSEHVARYAGAFGLIGAPGVGAIYAGVAQTFVKQALAGAASGSTSCATSGNYTVTLPTATSITAGENANVTFNGCVGEISAPGVSSHDSVTGSMSLQVQSVQGTVGATNANWSYTALASANNLVLTSSNGTTTLNGSVTYTTSYDAATGNTTTTASAPTVSIARTLPASNITGTITVGSLAFTRVQNPTTQAQTITASASIGIAASDVTMTFDVATSTPITFKNGSLTAGTLTLTSDNATETLVVQGSSTLGVTVTSNGKTGTYTEQLSDFQSLLGS